MQSREVRIVEQVSSPLYGMGVIGAALYFVHHSVGFVGALIGLLKALVWPAVLVYELLRTLGA